jgi:hypothetical protein
MLETHCSRVTERIQDWGEPLGESDASHARSCRTCGEWLRERASAGRALEALRDESFLDAEEWRLAASRAGALAQIRQDMARRERHSTWSPARWSMAAVLAGVAVLAVISDPGQVPAPAARATAAAAGGGDADVSVTTIATREGVTLSWDGGETAYVVLKSSRARGFDQAERTVVCGRSWTDRGAPPAGAVFYRVVPLTGPCHS